MRHIVSLSGGRDSSALALHLRETRLGPDYEFVFADTGAEFQVVYEFLDRLEEKLGKVIVRVSNGDFFSQFERTEFLPSVWRRWCTDKLKIRPIRKHVGNDPATMYIGITAEESERMLDKGMAWQANISYCYPFVEDNIDREGAWAILRKHGLADHPLYTKRGHGRSGCYLCFFQSERSWLKLRDDHPELFAKVKEMEERMEARWGSEKGYAARAKDKKLRELEMIQELPLFDAESEEDAMADACAICRT